MITFTVCVILLMLAAIIASLRPVYGIVTPKELQRRAKKGDQVAETLHDVSKYGMAADTVLLLASIITSALGFVLIANNLAGPLAVFCIAVLIFIIFTVLPRRTSKVSRKIALQVSPYLGPLLGKIRPILDRIVVLVQRHRPVTVHTGLYEKEDLIDLLRQQQVVPHNRIEETELDLAMHALMFGDKKVVDYMVPRRAISTVKYDDPVGPILLTELYKTGFSRFPVFNDDEAVVGTLYLKDLVDRPTVGSVADVMNRSVYYIDDTASLEGALAAFLKTKHHLFIVINGFEEIVGILTIEDVIEQIIGRKIVDEFDRYDDMRQVAALAAAKDSKKHRKP